MAAVHRRRHRPRPRRARRDAGPRPADPRRPALGVAPADGRDVERAAGRSRWCMCCCWGSCRCGCSPGIQRHPAVGGQRPRPGAMRRFGAANGQFILFRRTAYDRDRRARRGPLASRGGRGPGPARGRPHRARACGSSTATACRGFPAGCIGRSWKSGKGFTKNLRAAFEDSEAAFWASGLFQFAVFVLPFVLALTGAGGRLAWAEVALIYAVRGVLTWRFRTGLVGWLLHPVRARPGAGHRPELVAPQHRRRGVVERPGLRRGPSGSGGEMIQRVGRSSPARPFPAVEPGDGGGNVVLGPAARIPLTACPRARLAVMAAA